MELQMHAYLRFTSKTFIATDKFMQFNFIKLCTCKLLIYEGEYFHYTLIHYSKNMQTYTHICIHICHFHSGTIYTRMYTNTDILVLHLYMRAIF